MRESRNLLHENRNFYDMKIIEITTDSLLSCNYIAGLCFQNLRIFKKVLDIFVFNV